MALTEAGFALRLDVKGNPDPFDWGFGTTDEGKHICFITVIGEDVNAAHDAVASLGWRQRAQHDVLEDVALGHITPVQKLARLGLTPADVKAILGAA